MISTLWRKAFTDISLQVLGWGLGMGALLAVTAAVYPSISENYAEMVQTLPEEMLAFFGAEAALDTFEGYLNAEFFSYTPLILAVFAILAGTAGLAGEESRGTLEVLLAWPVSRRRLVAAKVSAILAGTGGIVLIMLLAFALTTPFLGVEVNWTRILATFALLWPFEAAIAIVSMLLSLLFNGRLLAGTIMAVALVASFILKSLAGLVSWLDAIQPVYLTSYYQGKNALVSEVEWGYTAALVGATLAAALLVFVLFERRDVGVRVNALDQLLPGRVREAGKRHAGPLGEFGSGAHGEPPPH